MTLRGRATAKISFIQFRDSLERIAEKKGTTRTEIVRNIRDTPGPSKKGDTEIKAVIADIERAQQKKRATTWKA